MLTVVRKAEEGSGKSGPDALASLKGEGRLDGVQKESSQESIHGIRGGSTQCSHGVYYTLCSIRIPSSECRHYSQGCTIPLWIPLCISATFRSGLQIRTDEGLDRLLEWSIKSLKIHGHTIISKLRSAFPSQFKNFWIYHRHDDYRYVRWTFHQAKILGSCRNCLGDRFSMAPCMSSNPF